MNQNICEVCKKPYEYALNVTYINGKKFCKHDSDAIESKVSLKRHSNYDASMMALKLAGEQKKQDAETGINKEIMVNPPPGKGGEPMKIPEKVIESIRAKVAPELEEIDK